MVNKVGGRKYIPAHDQIDLTVDADGLVLITVQDAAETILPRSSPPFFSPAFNPEGIDEETTGADSSRASAAQQLAPSVSVACVTCLQLSANF